MMEVVRAKHMGFCFGVRRAIDIVLKEVSQREDKVYTIGPIIHNPQMVEMLAEKGVIPVEDVLCITSGTVVFRTHGIRKEEEEYIRETGLRTIDATCPFVKRVRKRAMYLQKNGYQVVIVGDESHPEVKSVLSYLPNGGIVLPKPVSLLAKKIGVVTQTTLDSATLADVVKGLIRGAEELRVYNTICESTQVRQKEAAELASMVDAMLIVGGKNSSNTTKLYNIVKAVQPRTYHIETGEEIKPEWFSGLHKVGITGGASTPDYIIDSVERRVNNY
jgi:(E)-4-hydroxy-3-methyl-but-2-enyl pyrophosphate reductase